MHIYPKRASLEGLEIEIFKLVSYSATPEQWKEWLRVPLEHAAARGNLDLFNKLLGAGADGSAGWRGCRDRTMLDAAAVGGSVDIVSGLLQAGAQPDAQVVSCWSKRSALFTATMLGHEDVARRLMVAGADVNFEDPARQMCVVYEAVLGGHEQLVTELLIGGVNPNCRCGPSKVSPLHVAALRGFDGIASTLLLRGADKDALDVDMETPLMWASGRGRLSVVKTLLAHGADVSVRDAQNYSALDIAANEGHGDVVEAIVAYGTAVADADTSDNGFTALRCASRNDHAGAVNALIKAGTDVELKSTDGITPLGYAAYMSSHNAMLALLQHGAKLDVRDIDGNTPLHAACWGRRQGVEAAVDLLLRRGADETALTEDGHSPADMLDVDMNDDVDNPSTQNEIERTRLLLVRAPADRAWRRRGWLAVLRSRSKETRTTSPDGDSENEGGSSNWGRDTEGGRRKVARTHGSGGAERSVHGKVGAGSGTEGKGEGWSGVVELLLGMEVDGVFRTVVGFL